MIKSADSVIGNVLRIEKTSIHDGDGLRTVLFLKGCPLRCLWCSTPESWNQEPADGYGVKMSSAQAIREIAKDEVFYFHSGGGVTISGGEPLEQVEFVREVLLGCMERGIDRALETSFFSSWEKIKSLLPLLNLLHVDLKHPLPERHKRLTGVDNGIILDNIRRADDSPDDFKIVVRTPLVPGVNDSDEAIEASANFVRGLNKLKFMEFLAYHRLGTETYRKLGLEYPLAKVQTPTHEYMASKASLFQKIAGVPVLINGIEI